LLIVVEVVDNVGRLVDLGAGEDRRDFCRLFHGHDVVAVAGVAVVAAVAVALSFSVLI